MDYLCRSICVSSLLILLAACDANPPKASVAIPTAAITAGGPNVPPTAIPTLAPNTGTPRRPFPQHTIYTPGTIKPSRHSQEDLDKAVRNAYRLWKLSYL